MSSVILHDNLSGALGRSSDFRAVRIARQIALARVERMPLDELKNQLKEAITEMFQYTRHLNEEKYESEYLSSQENNR